MSTPDRQVSSAQWIARGIAIVVLVPIRLLWESILLLGRVTAAALRYIARYSVVPAAELIWQWVLRPAWIVVKDYLWGWVIQRLLWGSVLTPLLSFLLEYLLRPLRRAVEIFLWRKVIRPVGAWLLRWVVYPVVYAIAWVCHRTVEWLIVWPLTQLWRWVLRPLWGVLRTTARYGWRVATLVVGVLVVAPCRAVYRSVLRPVFTALAVVWRALVVRPVRWVHGAIVRPMNRWAAEVVAMVLGR
ncbi:hypothetical protein IU427_00590 [Nocardia beijingensis]|uniref:hypothetical protein n=1 Tax=Nocardia beijingensis TaxID=95162 RepID=UPI0018936DDF|nr:hypothetical protein [Nocardia beijingensis]MBF6463675.1 hypothetical protein [Nocardia beijingensis]